MWLDLDIVHAPLDTMPCHTRREFEWHSCSGISHLKYSFRSEADSCLFASSSSFAVSATIMCWRAYDRVPETKLMRHLCMAQFTNKMKSLQTTPRVWLIYLLNEWNNNNVWVVQLASCSLCGYTTLINTAVVCTHIAFVQIFKKSKIASHPFGVTSHSAIGRCSSCDKQTIMFSFRFVSTWSRARVRHLFTHFTQQNRNDIKLCAQQSNSQTPFTCVSDSSPSLSSLHCIGNCVSRWFGCEAMCNAYGLANAPSSSSSLSSFSSSSSSSTLLSLEWYIRIRRTHKSEIMNLKF